MKNKKITAAIALALAVSGCALFGLTGFRTTDAADQSASAEASLTESELFTQRDLEQEPDLSDAVSCTLTDGQTLSITEEGVYVLTGSASEATVVVDAADAKVQLVLDGLTLTNTDFPCIYVKNADKVFVTTVSDSSLAVTGSFVPDGETNTDAVIFSRDDLVLNGTAALSIRSTDNGVSSKDDLKVTGGSYVINAASKCLEARDSIRIAGGDFTLSAGTDGLHAENDEDDSLGSVYILDGSFTIDAGDDGIHANALAEISGGTFTISAAEGIEGTYVRLNGGTIAISSWDDGINAARKSSAYAACVEINGGDITITMGAGDTDGIDSNGNVIINGGTIRITGSSSFDYDGTAAYNGGTIIVNGQQLTSIPNQMMGGGFGGGQPGGFGGGQQGGGFGGGQPGGGFGGRR